MAATVWAAFGHGEEEGMRMMEELSLEDDANSVVVQGGVVQELRE